VNSPSTGNSLGVAVVACVVGATVVGAAVVGAAVVGAWVVAPLHATIANPKNMTANPSKDFFILFPPKMIVLISASYYNVKQ
jgi:hypothetical protein